MTHVSVQAKWMFLVEFEDQETGEVSGSMGQAESREECEALIRSDIEFHRAMGRRAFSIEAGELCATCDGNGTVPAGNNGFVLCSACDGHLGPISTIKMDL